MADWKKIQTDLKTESNKIYALYDKGKFSEAKKLLSRHINKISSISAVTDGETENIFIRLKRDRIIFQRVINLALATQNSDKKVKEMFSKLEKNMKSVNENVRKLNERIDDWESQR